VSGNPPRIVLCRTEGPRNVGSVLRAACNFGPAEIVLVAPQRRALLVHPEFEQMAHGVEDAAERIRVVETLEEGLAGTTDAIGFTGKLVRHRRVEPFRAVVDELADRIADPARRVALVFGAEQNGMLAEEAARCHRLVFLETSDEHTSLNLSMAVTVALFALFRPGRAPERRARFHSLEQRDREFLTLNVAETLADAALNDSAAGDIRASVRRIFATVDLEPRDARAWHLIMRAMGSTRRPDRSSGPDGSEGPDEPA
jgi:tRNA/rRNA methyltransferase